MRLLQLGPYPPPHGGVQTNLVAIRQFLRARAIPCAVINLTRHRKEQADEVYYPHSPLELVRLLFRLPYDIIHLHLGGNLTLRLLGLCLVCSLIPGSKTVLTFHSGGYPSSKDGMSAGRWTLRGFIFRRLDRIIGVNSQIIEMFRKFGVSSARLRLILPHSIAAAPPDVPLPDEIERFLESHTPVLLTVGLLEPEYDLPIQIEVLGKVRERHADAGLVIVGSGSLEDELRRRIKDKQYAQHIMLCGDVPHPVTLRIVVESTLFLRTTLYDGDSISVREALQLGKPVIATDNGMRPRGVELIPPSNITALQQAIERRLAHSSTPLTMREQDETNLEAVFNLYQELMKEIEG